MDDKVGTKELLWMGLLMTRLVVDETGELLDGLETEVLGGYEVLLRLC